MSIRLAFVVFLLAPVYGCASTTYEDKPGDAQLQRAIEQPFRDVSLMRENPPDILIRATTAPYQWDPDSGCTEIRAEIVALDLVLGPDLDLVLEETDQSSIDGNAILSGAIGGLIGLPYSGIVRRISGAEQRDRKLRKAILAGMVRRGFMKGLAYEAGCPMPELLLPDEILPVLGDGPLIKPIGRR